VVGPLVFCVLCWSIYQQLMKQQNWQEVADASSKLVKLDPVDFPDAHYYNAISNYYLMASYIETNQNLPEAERILADLEALRPGDRALGEIRQLIQKAKLEGGKSKSVLAHGPETEAGGRR